MVLIQAGALVKVAAVFGSVRGVGALIVCNEETFVYRIYRPRAVISSVTQWQLTHTGLHARARAYTHNVCVCVCVCVCV